MLKRTIMQYATALRRFSNKPKRVGYKNVEISVRHGSYEYMPTRVAPSCNVDVGGGDSWVSSTYFLVYEFVPDIGSLVMQRRAIKRALTAAEFLEARGMSVDVASGSLEDLRSDIEHYDEMIEKCKRTLMYRRYLERHPEDRTCIIGLNNTI